MAPGALSRREAKRSSGRLEWVVQYLNDKAMRFETRNGGVQ